MNRFQERVLEGLRGGGTVLTVNKRLARHIRQLYDERMLSDGRLAWESAPVLSLESWLHSVPAASGEEWRLLDRFAAQRIWENVIEEDAAKDSPGLLQVPSTARRAMEAHQLLADYEVALPPGSYTADQAAFMRWRDSFVEICRKEEWLEPGALAAHVAEMASGGRMKAPAHILLAGFDEIVPSHRRLFEILGRSGAWIEEIPAPAGSPDRILRKPCTDTLEEVRRAACWSRRLLERGEGNIGIVVPRLGEWRNLIERVFKEEIDPLSLLSPAAEDEAFGLSLGVRLADQGPVVAAIELLGLDREIPLRTASRLLRSPYLAGSVAEESSRAHLEERLRGFGEERVRLSRLAALAREGKPHRAPRFARICETLESHERENRKRTPGEWAEHFADLLSAVGWPGERPSDSREYQVLSAWREKLLPALIGLDRVSGPLGRTAAASLLQRIATETEFHPETPQSPIQVIGHLEAAGLRFDHLWVLGLSEDVLPAPAAPNPFLPQPLQSACRMPHADGEREQEYARKIVARLFAAAPQVVVSHPCRRGDCELRPSPLIRGIPVGEVEFASTSAPTGVLAQQAPPLEFMRDRIGPPLVAGTPVAGGTAILRDQALCPFRAFVRHRLSGKALEVPRPGIDPRTRGTLLHGALERFWNLTGSHQGLLELEPSVLGARVRQVVTETVEKAGNEGWFGAPAAVLEIEIDRLAELIAEWLEIEKERPPFTVVETEREHLERFGELTIRTKVDRVDRIGEGDFAVIDYKTGRIDFEDLLGDRLIEPQLPIYGTGEGTPDLGGVGFGMVRRGECALKGLCREDAFFPGIEAFAGSRAARTYGIEGWAGLLSRWRSQLAELSEEFLRGEATVSPVDFAKACRYCDLPALCRIDEIVAEGDGI